MQRRIAHTVPAVHIRSARNQLGQQLLAAAPTHQVHGRQPLLVLRIEIPVSAFEQLRHDRIVALLGRTMQQIGFAVAARVRRRSDAPHEGGQLGDQSAAGRFLVVVDERVQAVNGRPVVDREEGVAAVSPDLIVNDVGQKANGEHKVAVGRVTVADQKGAVGDVVWVNEC